MRTYPLNYYNSTILDLYIEPAEDRLDDEDDSFNMSSLNFTWEAVRF
jgi:hypothetical protein